MGRLKTLDARLAYLLGDLLSAPTAVGMHIVCIHMAMVVIRIASNIVLCFYRSRAGMSSPMGESVRFRMTIGGK